jgi:MFS-type transporter involved in bile tolerance (Atg22 family)
MIQSLVTGLVYGAFQGYARAFYAELLPPGEEARWYGLFSITDKVRKKLFLCSSSLLLTTFVVHEITVQLLHRPSGCRVDF